jgi:hypothetical protein
MLVVAAEQLLGVDCETAAAEEALRQTARREWQRRSFRRNGGVREPLLLYTPLEAWVPHAA